MNHHAVLSSQDVPGQVPELEARILRARMLGTSVVSVGLLRATSVQCLGGIGVWSKFPETRHPLTLGERYLLDLGGVLSIPLANDLLNFSIPDVLNTSGLKFFTLRLAYDDPTRRNMGLAREFLGHAAWFLENCVAQLLDHVQMSGELFSLPPENVEGNGQDVAPLINLILDDLPRVLEFDKFLVEVNDRFRPGSLH